MPALKVLITIYIVEHELFENSMSEILCLFLKFHVCGDTPVQKHVQTAGS